MKIKGWALVMWLVLDMYSMVKTDSIGVEKLSDCTYMCLRSIEFLFHECSLVFHSIFCVLHCQMCIVLCLYQNRKHQQLQVQLQSLIIALNFASLFCESTIAENSSCMHVHGLIYCGCISVMFRARTTTCWDTRFNCNAGSYCINQ